MKIITIAFYLLLTFMGVSFAALNASSTQVNFYFTTIKMPISVLMTLALGVGILLGFVLFLYRYWGLKSEHRKIKSQLRLTEKEIKNLRAIPLRNEH
jgi:putative membrane protein